MKTLLPLIVAVAIAPFLASPAIADDSDPEKIIKYRQDFMQAVKNHNNSIKAIVNGAVPFNNHLDMHLASLEKLFSEVNSLFPEGSDFGDTKAKPAVWDNPQKFSETVKKSQQALTEFKQVVDSGDMNKARSAFKNFGRSSCGSCHKSFKEKD